MTIQQEPRKPMTYRAKNYDEWLAIIKTSLDDKKHKLMMRKVLPTYHIYRNTEKHTGYVMSYCRTFYLPRSEMEYIEPGNSNGGRLCIKCLEALKKEEDAIKERFNRTMQRVNSAENTEESAKDCRNGTKIK